MALINCDECGFEVSDKASACPKCGNPIAISYDEKEETVLIEQTSKDLKLKLLIGVVVMGIGLLIAQKVDNTIGLIIVSVALVFMFIVRAMIWWNHK